jgi:16S rRNA (guanine966-N2)-methyltransferase
MRIVAGEWRGRVIKAPPGLHVRPTRDRVREAWMSIVNLHLPGARVLDLCAGSGALGLEALSRGAHFAQFVEQDPRTVAVLKANLASLGGTTRATVRTGDAVAFVRGLGERSFDIAFADPPYASGVAVRLAEQWLAVPFATLLSIEHASAQAMPPGGDTRRYGTSSITFYR